MNWNYHFAPSKSLQVFKLLLDREIPSSFFLLPSRHTDYQ
jgi:hypothetical protein